VCFPVDVSAFSLLNRKCLPFHIVGDTSLQWSIFVFLAPPQSISLRQIFTLFYDLEFSLTIAILPPFSKIYNLPNLSEILLLCIALSRTSGFLASLHYQYLLFSQQNCLPHVTLRSFSLIIKSFSQYFSTFLNVLPWDVEAVEYFFCFRFQLRINLVTFEFASSFFLQSVSASTKI